MSGSITINPVNAEAQVYYDFINAKDKHVYLVKVSLIDIGVYINSITVQPSSKYPDSLWVQSPRFNIRGKWIWPLQMQKESPLWILIEALALTAVDEFSKGNAEATGLTNASSAFVKQESRFL